MPERGDEAGVAVGTVARPPWANTKRSHHRAGEYARSESEWMPRPFGGRVMVTSRKTANGGAGVYLQVIPGPAGLWQIVRVELNTPVARGFRTPNHARAWVARAIRQGVLPEGVVVVEPPPLPD